MASIEKKLVEAPVVLHGVSWMAICSLASTTWRRADLKRGLEADECYYIRNEAAVRGKTHVDLQTDPPPDLAIEIDFGGSWPTKPGVYAALGVPELWRFDGEILEVYELSGHREYVQRADSLNLPGFPVGDVPQWIARAGELDETAWVRAFRAWVQSS